MGRGLSLADQVLRKDSTANDAWMARAYLVVQQHPRTLQGAAAAFRRAITLDPTNAEGLYQYGRH